MISTDNHLGVWEKDETRRNDSFAAFEEVLKNAVDMHADFVLLGGDLFHENKPSRHSVVNAISVLRKHCLGTRDHRFEILSDKTKNFVGGTVNYEDERLAVGLPVFTIHGNHDDPTGTDNLSAVDILSSCGLVNYFGKVFISGTAADGSTSKVDLAPILFRKGNTYVALYGLGAIRDERLGRMFNTPGAVSWQRAPSIPGCHRDDWFSIFVLHQNRVRRGPNAKNCVLESHLPEWLDYVVWGHEHQCFPEAVRADNPAFPREDDKLPLILQPGSTVATALSEGEAARKHCFILEVNGSGFRTLSFALDSQRPFVYDTVCLKDVRHPAPLKAEDQDGIAGFLEAKVTDMIATAVTSREGPSADLLPLIRLKVDYTGFTTVNAQRFGQKFVGRVANPHDILTWVKAAPKRLKAEPGAEGGEGDEWLDADLLRPEALDQARMDVLIKQNLQTKLQLLTEEELASALHDFVEKDERNALVECVASEVAARLKGSATMKVIAAPAEDEELRDQLMAAAQKDRLAALTVQGAEGAGPSGAAGADDGEDPFSPGLGSDPDDMEEPRTTGRGKAKATPSAKRGAAKAAAQAAAAKPPTGRSKAKTAGKGKQLGVLEAFNLASQKQAASQQLQLNQEQHQQDGVEEDEEEDFVTLAETLTAPKPSARRGAARATGGTAAGKAKATPTRGKGKSAGGRSSRREVDSDAVESDEPDAISSDGDAGGGGGVGTASAPAARPRRAVRAAAAKRSTRLDEDDAANLSDSDEYQAGDQEESEDDDEIEVASSDEEGARGAAKPGSKRKRGGNNTAAAPPRKRATPAKPSSKAAAGGRGVRHAGTAADGGQGGDAGAGAGLLLASRSQPPSFTVDDDDAIRIESSEDERPAAPAARVPAPSSAGHTGDKHVATLQLATTGIMSMGYAHKVSDKITLASDFLWQWQSREATATVGFDCMLRQCRLRGKIDTNGVVSSYLEERFAPGINFVLSAELDHGHGNHRFGFGVVAGE